MVAFWPSNMLKSWNISFTEWYKHWRQRQHFDKAGSSLDVELGIYCKHFERIDSGISLRDTNDFSSCHTSPDVASQDRLSNSIYLELDFGDKTCIKSLDYGTFSHWAAIEGFMFDMEEDGILWEELWDATESMIVGEGDWDARVRPGWYLHVHCQHSAAMLESPYFEDETDSESEDLESEGEHWIDDVLGHYQEEWCLPRWRHKIELEKSINAAMQEPSWIMLVLGCISVALFMVAAVVYTT